MTEAIIHHPDPSATWICEAVPATTGLRCGHTNRRKRGWMHRHTCARCGCMQGSRGVAGEAAHEDVVRRRTVREMVDAFARLEAVVRRSFADIVEAEREANLVMAVSSDRFDRVLRVDAGGTRHSSSDFEAVDDAIERLRRDAWRAIVEHLEIRRAMSVAAQKDLDAELEHGKPLPVTEETVRALVARYAQAMPDLFLDSLREVFEFLRPHGSRHKTNTELEIGPRVVLTWMVERWWHSGGWRVRYNREEELRAVERVFSLLDGQGAQSKEYRSALSRAIGEAGLDGVGETEYFAFRACKNGNLHLRFKRLDLLAELNRRAGGMNLRA